MSRRSRLLVVSAVFVSAMGCGGAPSGMAPKSAPSADGVEVAREAAPGQENPPAGGGKPADPAPVQRKIIYSGTVEVVVKNLDESGPKVEALVAEHKGYVSKSEVTGTVGSRRSATWTLKIPAEKFRPVVKALADLGSVVRNSSDSQDVTEEYVDVEARVKNMKVEEDALNKMMVEPGLTLENRIRLRTEIGKVRGDIERAEGRLKYLAGMSAMSTITLTLREDAAYIPPDPAAAPTFADRVEATFGTSWSGLVDFAQGVALFAVALTPWLPLLIVVALILRWALKRLIALGSPSATTPRRAKPVAARAVPVIDPTPTDPPATT